MSCLLYAALPVVMGLLALFSRNIKEPESLGATGLTKVFCRIATFLYERVLRKRVQAKLFPIERSLRLLEPRSKGTDAGRDFFIKKLADVLMLLTVGSVLGIALYVAARQNPLIDETGSIARASYEERAQDTVLYAETAEGEALGAFDVHISSRRYTKQEADDLFLEASKVLPDAILGENPSLNEVTKDLLLVTSLEGYPFELSWKCGNYARIHSDGRVDFEDIEEAGEVVMLTATYTYFDETYEQILHAHVKAPVPDIETQKKTKMEALLASADEETVQEDFFALPKTFEGATLLWNETVRDNSALVFLLMAVAACVIFFARDKEVTKQMEERNRQMLSDYPQFVSQLVLYLGAGLSMRGIVKKLAGEYAAQRKETEEVRFLREELLRMTYVLEGGMAEAGAYEQFGLRCGIRQYTRLCTLLTQNLRKGSNDLLRLLEEESRKAFSERIDLARKRGEEAGTKLLVPMMLLLGIVMVIIMIPAYAAF